MSLVGLRIDLNSGASATPVNDGTATIAVDPVMIAGSADTPVFIDRQIDRQEIIDSSDDEFDYVADESSYPTDILAERGITNFDLKPFTVLQPDSSEIAETKKTTSDWDSELWTVEQLSSNAVVSKYPIRPQRGLTVAQITENLNLLAVNVLDPIKARYPDAIVTSGFRKGARGSQHHLGQAADIQILGWSNDDAFEFSMWVAQNIPTDQLIYETKDTGTKLPWVHVSFSAAKNRGAKYTYFNHKKYSNGLAMIDEPKEPTVGGGGAGEDASFSYFSVMTPEEAGYYNFRGTGDNPINPFPEPDWNEIVSRR
jgi:hypothetical protein